MGVYGSCLYIAPIEIVPVNQPPHIEIKSPNSAELVLVADFERARVTASDPDGDPLYFVWSGVPADVEITPDPPFPETFGDETWWTSIYKVPRDPRLDGKTIQVFVYDNENESDPVSWTARVEQ